MADQKKEDINDYVKATSSLARANNHLCLKLQRGLTKDQRNVFFSPFSVSTALAMLYHGARRETAAQMRKVVGYDIADMDDDLVSSSYEQLLKTITTGAKSYDLTVANSVMIDKRFPVNGGYKTSLKEVYKAAVEEVDFQNDVKSAVAKINEYVKKNTNNMIPKLVETLDPATLMVLLNAVYFKGAWSMPFKKYSTRPKKFFNNGLEADAKEVPMMRQKDSFLFVETESYKALEMSYEGDISMMLLLPNSRNGLLSLENSLFDKEDFLEMLKGKMRQCKVDVTLPKFRMESSQSLREIFQDLGMGTIFRGDADFGGVSEDADLIVSDIIHKAVVEVNEEGSEAAAATAIMCVGCCAMISKPDPEFVVDHPFLFFIYDTRNELILFSGRVQVL